VAPCHATVTEPFIALANSDPNNSEYLDKRKMVRIDHERIQERISHRRQKARLGKRAVRNLIKVGLVAIVPFLGLAAPVVAGPFEDGLAAHKRGDYATALRLWHPPADQGDAHAQFNPGFMYAKVRACRRTTPRR
jgi:hypothetical protein